MVATLDRPTDDGPRPPAADLLTARMRGRRRLADLLATGFLGLSFLIALVPLALVLSYVISKGAKVVDWEFLTTDIPRQARTIGPGCLRQVLRSGELATPIVSILVAASAEGNSEPV